MGFNAAHSNYACIYCTVKKDKRYLCSTKCFNYQLYAPFNRHDTSIDPMVYQTTLSRTLSKIKDCAQEKKLGVIHEPLLNIEVSNVRIIV